MRKFMKKFFRFGKGKPSRYPESEAGIDYPNCEAKAEAYPVMDLDPPTWEQINIDKGMPEDVENSVENITDAQGRQQANPAPADIPECGAKEQAPLALPPGSGKVGRPKTKMDKPIILPRPGEEYLTPREAASMLGLSRQTVYKYLALGHLPAASFNGKSKPCYIPKTEALALKGKIPFKAGRPPKKILTDA